MSLSGVNPTDVREQLLLGSTSGGAMSGNTIRSVEVAPADPPTTASRAIIKTERKRLIHGTYLFTI